MAARDMLNPSLDSGIFLLVEGNQIFGKSGVFHRHFSVPYSSDLIFPWGHTFRGFQGHSVLHQTRFQQARGC